MGESVTASFASLEIGAARPSTSSFIDFHYVGTNDYDGRILCNSGKAGTSGAGGMTYYGGTHRFVGGVSFDHSAAFNANVVIKGSASCITAMNVNAPNDASNSHLWFYGAEGASRGVVYAPKDGSIRIRPDSNDIGGSNGYSFAFSADGKFTCVTVNQTSDERVKFDKEPISNALDKLCSLTGYTFGIQLAEVATVRSAGIIAQELEKVLPVAVSSGGIGITPDGEELNDLKTVDYSAMSALYVEAFKELATRLASLDNEIKMLRGKDDV